MQNRRFFLSAQLGGETVEREVTLAEYCAAERQAGFYPKGLTGGDPAYQTTPATGGFGAGAISGRTEYVPEAA